MKNFLWMVSGICAAAVGVILWGPNRTQPVQQLALLLEEGWADQYTIV